MHLPPYAESARYSILSSLLADYLLQSTSYPSAAASPLPNFNALDFALNVLPGTLQGLEVNIDFIKGGFSRQDGSPKGELELFQLANVPIRHGWLASKDDQETWMVLSSRRAITIPLSIALWKVTSWLEGPS